MRGDGDGWSIGPDGLRHWGKYGAAGLLLRAPLAGGGSAVLLQHRAPWSHQGGTWALPGGAKDSQGVAETAAARKAKRKVKVIDPMDILCPKTERGRRCPAVVGNALVYRDTYHVSATYARTLVDWLAPRLPGV